MEIGASLAQLEISASEPRRLAAFYARTFCLDVAERNGAIDCDGSGRSLRIVAGESGQLRRASLRFHTASQFEEQRQVLAARGIETLANSADGFSVRDPEGQLVTFLAPAGQGTPPRNEPLTARLQHFAVRTPAAQALLDFYVNQLGFVLSDRVLDDAGNLTAAFMRTDSEHHSMAIFRAPESRFDHFSCEAPDWNHLREWADHMARVGVDLAWGVGRHGPGNDTFLMVRDMDGNMGEISCDLEVCEPGRPAGVWPHRPQTLNQWGVAIMRS
ncbi:MAG: Glyoxalase/Bleomycin resistance protein/Dioxygenase superfamily protein [Ramlibacter sp.]|nr:Glyoxalase/Bleomycin resistance protein/Dioxygenase superfamily protein [Ramlibacter sp.]